MKGITYVLCHVVSGRVARAGQSGTAYSIISPDEVPLMLDLHLSLGRPVKYVVANKHYPTDVDGLCGRVPQTVLDDEDEDLQRWNKMHDIVSLCVIYAPFLYFVFQVWLGQKYYAPQVRPDQTMRDSHFMSLRRPSLSLSHQRLLSEFL